MLYHGNVAPSQPYVSHEQHGFCAAFVQAGSGSAQFGLHVETIINWLINCLVPGDFFFPTLRPTFLLESAAKEEGLLHVAQSHL